MRSESDQYDLIPSRCPLSNERARKNGTSCYIHYLAARWHRQEEGPVYCVRAGAEQINQTMKQATPSAAPVENSRTRTCPALWRVAGDAKNGGI